MEVLSWELHIDILDGCVMIKDRSWASTTYAIYRIGVRTSNMITRRIENQHSIHAAVLKDNQVQAGCISDTHAVRLPAEMRQLLML